MARRSKLVIFGECIQCKLCKQRGFYFLSIVSSVDWELTAFKPKEIFIVPILLLYGTWVFCGLALRTFSARSTLWKARNIGKLFLPGFQYFNINEKQNNVIIELIK